MNALWVITAAVTNFVLCMVWYAVFRDDWMKGWQLSKQDINSRDPKPYLVAFIGSLWAAYGVFLICKHIQPKGVLEQLTIALGCWLFIEVGMGAKHYALARVNGRAFAVDYGVDLVGFILMTFIVW